MQQTYFPFPEMIHFSTLPSLPLVQREALPDEPGIYFLFQGSTLRYIGRTISLKKRWAAHHRWEQYSKSEETIIAWLIVSHPMLLSSVEHACITYFDPPDNWSPIPVLMLSPREALSTTSLISISVEVLRDIFSNIQYRLGCIPQSWSEIACIAGIGYATVEGLAKGRPGRCNPRFATLCSLLGALEEIEERLRHAANYNA